MTLALQHNSNVSIDHLPDGVVWEIASFLKTDDALAWSQTSKHFNEKISSEIYFKYRLVQNFPLLKTIQGTFVTPFESQIPDFWKSLSICLDNGLISTSPMSAKGAVVSLKCLPPIYVKMPYQEKSVYLISKNLDSVKWCNSIRYFAHILKVFKKKLDLVPDLETFKLKSLKYAANNDNAKKTELLDELYEIQQKYNRDNTPVLALANTKHLNAVSYLMSLEEHQVNWSLAMICKRQVSLLCASSSELDVEKILMLDWRESMQNLIPTEAFFEENKKTIVLEAQ